MIRSEKEIKDIRDMILNSTLWTDAEKDTSERIFRWIFNEN